MLTFQNKYKLNIHSQNGENGIIAECIKRIKPKLTTAVEFGAPSFTYCSNVAFLADEGWTVKMFDIDKNTDPRISQAMITPENVNQVTGEPSVLSIDVDNDDYHIWDAYKGKPAIVIIEVNSSVLPPAEMIPGAQGASYYSMAKLAIEKGYFVLCHTGNIIAVLNKYRNLFPEIVGDGLSNWQEYFNTSHL